MKFKYGDKVKFDDEFYGKGEGRIIEYEEIHSKIDGITFDYQIEVIEGKAEGAILCFREKNLKK